MAFSSFSVTVYVPYMALYRLLPFSIFSILFLSLIAVSTVRVHFSLSPTLTGVQPASLTRSPSTLYTCCSTSSASGYWATILL
jgi:hypothetical protein